MQQGNSLTVMTQLPLQPLSTALPNHRKWGRSIQRGHFASFSKAFASTRVVPERGTQPAFKNLHG